MRSQRTTPVLVAGGGPVGSVLALALSRSGVNVTLVDHRAESAHNAEGNAGNFAAPNNDRPIALSASSARILHTLGVWPSIATRACPIQTVHVCEQARFGAVRLRASEHDVAALGYVTDASVIGAALAPAVAQADNINSVRAVQVQRAQLDGDRIRAVFDGATLEQCADDRTAAQLLVVADGGHSSLCANLGIHAQHHDYEQMAVVCTISPQRAHMGTAYERFTAHGPLAILPMVGGQCSVVWTLPHEQALDIVALDDANFVQALQRSFGSRLGRLRVVSERKMFALSLVRAQQLSSARVALIGNAANQLHPVAGQGLNLGLRDAAVLADLIAQAMRDGDDVGSEALLQRYAAARRAEHRGVVRFTDILARGFSAGPRWLGWLRGAGMLALDVLPVGRHLLARHAMGLGGSQARLVRGLNP